MQPTNPDGLRPVADYSDEAVLAKVCGLLIDLKRRMELERKSQQTTNDASPVRQDSEASAVPSPSVTNPHTIGDKSL